MRNILTITPIILLSTAIATIADECHIICADVKRSVPFKSACSAFRNSLPRPKVSPALHMHNIHQNVVASFTRTSLYDNVVGLSVEGTHSVRMGPLATLVSRRMLLFHTLSVLFFTCRWHATARKPTTPPWTGIATRHASTTRTFSPTLWRVGWTKSAIAL